MGGFHFNRRGLLLSGAATAALGATAACSKGGAGGGAAAGKSLKIGFVSPKTGPLAAFAEADTFVIDQLNAAWKDGVNIGGVMTKVEILVRDSQSNPSRAAEVAGELILKDGIDLMLVGNTPENANPVSDQCEVNETPCISSLAPWQSWFFRSKDVKPDTGYNWTYHFFWGLEDITGVFMDMWDQIPTDKAVGGLFPNDADGNAWADPKTGFTPAVAPRGYKVIDSGRFQDQTDDFSSQIAKFKAANAEIVTGVIIPPDLTTFWTQARQQGFKPKIASIGKAILFPSSVEALGAAGNNLSCEVWWSPNHPFKSSLTGATAQQMADAYTAATKKQWSQPIGFAHALFEVAIDVVKRAGGPGDKKKLRDAIAATKLDTIVGNVDWSKGPVKNVAKTPLVGGQWRMTPGGPNKFELMIVSNKSAPLIPAASKMEALT